MEFPAYDIRVGVDSSGARKLLCSGGRRGGKASSDVSNYSLHACTFLLKQFSPYKGIEPFYKPFRRQITKKATIPLKECKLL